MKKHTFISMAICSSLLVLALMPAISFSADETGGIGMEVLQLYNHKADDHRGNIIVLNVFKDSPAEKQGIQAGDIILEINETKTAKHDFEDLLHNQLRGSSGTGVKVKIYRPSTKQIMKIVLVRVQMIY